ncbi:MAG TPA: 50S ribosomal protein L9 [Chloroflexota bacterium]|nr:50S ribosomal protein L9 [Chloroflexota bacterium]
MKVVLLANVKNVGRIGDLAEVADGYARNFLIPQSLASPASLKIMRSVEFQKKLERNREIQEQIEAEVLAGGLQGAVVVIPAAVGGDNRIHGQITNQQIADAILEQLELKIDRHKIEIDQPLRNLGMTMLPVRITRGLEASITVDIVDAEEYAAAQAAEAAAEAEALAAAEAAEAETAEAALGGVDDTEFVDEEDTAAPEEL